MKEADQKIAQYQSAYDNALKSGNAAEIAAAKKILQHEQEMQLLKNDNYKSMVDYTTTQIANANKLAAIYMNDEVPSMYAIGYSTPSELYSVSKEVEKAMKSMFDIRDEYAVRRRVLKGDVDTPFMHTKKYLDIPKDKRWNTKKINSSVLQGMLNGESIADIANRIMTVVDTNEASAIRNARTLMTGAENAGRLDRYKALEDQGAVMSKVWMATGDSRTRDWHLEMDGQEVKTDESFVDGLGNELEYPGDPGAPGETVYNCRCSMRGHVIGFKKSDGNIKYVKYNKGKTLHDKEIEKERSNRK